MQVAAWFAVVGLMHVALAVRAGEPVARNPVERADNSRSAHTAGTTDAAGAGTAGVRARLDPVTGKLIDAPATPASRAPAESLDLPAPDYSKVTMEARADGSVIAHTNGQFQSTSTIQIDADGGKRIGCTQTGPHADHDHASSSARRSRE